MKPITRQQLEAFLDDALSEQEASHVEQALRGSEELRAHLRAIMQERDRGEHSIGAIWRRERLTCPTREQLGSYLLQVLESDWQEYIDFHLRIIACPFCRANLTDLQTLRQEPAPQVQERRRRFFESSAGYLNVGRDAKS
ncbi:MAG: hypothetical protein ACK4RK_02650 [Gemmataceae bacterium]